MKHLKKQAVNREQTEYSTSKCSTMCLSVYVYLLESIAVQCETSQDVLSTMSVHSTGHAEY